MNPEQALIELLDQYAAGKLSAEDAAALEQRLKADPAFREKAEQHAAFVQELKFFGERNALREHLNEIHTSIDTVHIPLAEKPARNKKYWPMLAVAASVALLCIFGTVYFTQSLERRQAVNYQALRRNLDQIRQSQKLIMEDLAETKEKIFPGNYAGSGFLISATGYVATSYHVIREADSVVIENETFGRLRATIVHSDPVNDIAILKINKPVRFKSLPYAIAKAEANLAEDVYTLGFPREDIVFGEGSVSALTGYRQNPNAYQISVPVNPGNSGGPLLNSKGDLIGMISGIQTQTAGAAFAIKSSVLLEAIENPVLDSLTSPINLPKQNSIKNSTRVQQVKQWKDFVFMIRVYKD
jgi:serine protease Do